jgi:hypothetical protein
MDINKESPFIRGIENRLEAIFESDNKRPDKAEADVRNLKEDDPLKEVTIGSDIPGVDQAGGKEDFKLDQVIDSTQSSFLSSIESRLDAIFESDNKRLDQAEADMRNLKEDDPLKEVTIERDVPDTLHAGGKKDTKVDKTIDSVQSSFLRGIEDRLDAILESDQKQPDQAAADMQNPKEDDPLKEVTFGTKISGVDQTDDKKDFKADESIESTPSQLLQGIDNRLDAIFGAEISGMHHLEEDDPLKEVAIETDISDIHQIDGKRDFKIDETIGMTEEPSLGHGKENHLILGDSNMSDHTEEAGIHNMSEPESLKKAVAEAELSNEKDDKVERFEQLFEELITSTSIWYSPLKDLKSTVLSIEWELTDEIMEKFDKEVDKLINLFAEDNIVLGFLRILRFLGRYIKVKGIEAHYVSIKLLLSIYDDLERVLLTKEMTETKKHAVLLGNIEKYREWVETVDLTVRDEDKWAEEEIRPEAAKRAVPDRYKENVITSPIILSKMQERTMEETRRTSKDELSSLDPISGMTPHEAFAYALDEIKKVISAEFSALKAELKLWRQGQ